MLDCLGCNGYDSHPTPTIRHYVLWHEIRNGVGTRTDDKTNQAGQRGEGE